MLIILFAFTLLPAPTLAQEAENYNENDIYYQKILPPTFAIEFKDEDDRRNFEKLRNYLNDKENLKKTLNNALNYSDIYIETKNSIEKTITILTDTIKNKKDNDLILIEDTRLFTENLETTFLPTITKTYTVKFIKNKITELNELKTSYIKVTKENENINQNIKIISQDIKNCQDQIDTALQPVIRDQEFKTTMSICFVVLIGILLASFFLIIYLKSDNSLSKDLLSGYGLQFITLFVLIIAIILFGILDILKGSELAAMLSGISGYILGKGIQDKKVVSEGTTTTPPTPQDPVTVVPVTVINDPIINDPVVPDPVVPDPVVPDPVVPDPVVPDPDVSDPEISDPVKPNQDQP